MMKSKKDYFVNTGRRTYIQKGKPQQIRYRVIDNRQFPTFDKEREASIKKLIKQIQKDAFGLSQVINTDSESQQLEKMKTTLELIENVIIYTKPNIKE